MKKYARFSFRSIENAKFLRRNQTHAEIILWSELRRHRLGGYKFRRQHPFQQFVFDFFCPSLRLVIEIDGDVHNRPDQSDRDNVHDEHLFAMGLHVIRIPNHDIENDIPAVIRSIQEEIDLLRKI